MHDIQTAPKDGTAIDLLFEAPKPAVFDPNLFTPESVVLKHCFWSNDVSETGFIGWAQDVNGRAVPALEAGKHRTDWKPVGWQEAVGPKPIYWT